MSSYVVSDTSLTAVADAIRAKANKSGELIFPEGFTNAINGIEREYDLDQISDHAYSNNLNPILTSYRIFPYAFMRAPFKTVTSYATIFTDKSDGVTSGIGESVFESCQDLELISFPNLKDPGSGGYQFAYCTKLGTINLPSAKFIGQHMFHGCTALQTAVFNAVTSTNNNGFQDCRALQIVDFGSLVSLKSQEFYGCTKLNTIILRRSTAITSLTNVNNFTGSLFASGKAGGTIYIPKVLYDELGTGSTLDYKSATNWSTLDGYGTVTWATIEGSQYETQYADGTPIT